jgi:hypothetical protein
MNKAEWLASRCPGDAHAEALAEAQDRTWFWRIVDEAGLANLPSDEEAALRILCECARDH